MERVSGDSGAIASSTNSYGTGLRCLTAKAGLVQQEEGRIATGLQHTSDESRSFTSASNKYRTVSH